MLDPKMQKCANIFESPNPDMCRICPERKVEILRMCVPKLEKHTGRTQLTDDSLLLCVCCVCLFVVGEQIVSSSSHILHTVLGVADVCHKRINHLRKIPNIGC